MWSGNANQLTVFRRYVKLILIFVWTVGVAVAQRSPKPLGGGSNPSLSA